MGGTRGGVLRRMKDDRDEQGIYMHIGILRNAYMYFAQRICV